MEKSGVQVIHVLFSYSLKLCHIKMVIMNGVNTLLAVVISVLPMDDSSR